jgi:uncharacterized protein (TIGR03435 family)
MRALRMAVLGLLIAATAVDVATQTAPQTAPAAGPTFDVVSIERSGGGVGFRLSERPDGGFNATNYPVANLIARAYPPAVPVDIVGLPSWTSSERYDVRTTATRPNVTQEERKAMLRAMLAGRFKLAVHFEEREQPAFDLVLARSDGQLGPGMRPSEVDCVAQAEARRKSADALAGAGQPLPAQAPTTRSGPIAPCSVRTVGPLMEGDVTMAGLTTLLRQAAGRYIVDKTGLTGTYRVTLEYDRLGASGGLEAKPDGPPSVFTAVQEQLGLKLVPSRAKRDTLVIDRLERPTENDVDARVERTSR